MFRRNAMAAAIVLICLPPGTEAPTPPAAADQAEATGPAGWAPNASGDLAALYGALTALGLLELRRRRARRHEPPFARDLGVTSRGRLREIAEFRLPSARRADI
jgi:hypothetical protein